MTVLLTLSAIFFIQRSPVQLRDPKLGSIASTGRTLIPVDPSQNDVSIPASISKKTTATSILIKNFNTGETLLAKNSSVPLPIASIVKLMTAIVGLETGNPKDHIMITPEALATYGDSAHLHTQELFTRNDILWPILMMSSNDATEAIARYYGRSNFITHMHGKAAQIGMSHSTWRDPSGISSGNISTTEDLFLLARHVNLFYPEIWEMTRTAQKVVTSSERLYTFHTFNNPRHHPGFVGGKNGHTSAAKDTLLYIFENSRKEKIAYIILGSPDAETDLEFLLNADQN